MLGNNQVLTEKQQESTPLIVQQNSNSEISISEIVYKVIKLGLPMAFSYTFILTEVITAIMISHLEKENPEIYLSTSELLTPLTNTLVCVAISPLLAIGNMVSEKYGELISQINEKNKTQLRKEIANIFKTGIILSTFILPFLFSSMFFSKYILTKWFKQNENISTLVQENLRIYSFATPAIMYRLCAEQIMFSFEKQFETMLIGLTCVAIGTAFSYFFSFSAYKLGLAGIAYGYVIESYLTWLLFSLYMKWHKDFKKINFFNFLHVENFFLHVRDVLRIGLSFTTQILGELFAIFLIGIFSGWFNDKDNVSAAQNFAIQLFVFAVIPSDAFAQAVTQEMCRLKGGKDYINAARFSIYGLLINMGLIFVIYFPISVAPKLLTNVFSTSIEPKVIKIANCLIPLAAWQSIAETGGVTMVQVLRALGDPYKPIIIKITSLWLGVLIAYLLGFKTSLHIYGVDSGFLLGVFLGTGLLLPRFLMKATEKNIRLEDEMNLQLTQTQASLFHESNKCYGSGEETQTELPVIESRNL